MMNTMSKINLVKRTLLLLLICITVLSSACGGGGGGGSSSGGAVGGSLYITDDVTDNRQVIFTIYKVEFERASDASRVVVFEDNAGQTFDMTEFNGIMAQLSGTVIPAESFSKVFVTVGETLVLVDSLGNKVSPNPTFDPADLSTSCSAGKCEIEIQSSFSVAAGQKVVLDFDLKQFVYNSGTGLVTAKVVLDDDGSDHFGYIEMDLDDSELEGIIDSMGANSFVITIFKAEHFMPTANVMTVNVNGFTRYGCDDHSQNCGISSFADLAPGMRVEMHGALNGSDFDATEVELDEDNDLKTANCTTPSRSIASYTNLLVQPELKETGGYTFNGDSSLTLTTSGKTILITKETVIKDETTAVEKLICDIEIPGNANEVEVEYYTAKDGQNNAVNVAFKIEFEN